MRLRGFLFALLCLCLTGCGLETSGIGPSRSLWLDSPVETETTTDTAVAITVHANFELSEVTIGYNLVGSSNIPYSVIPMTMVGPNLYEGVTTWSTDDPGEYNLRAYTMDGIIAPARYLRVNLPGTPVAEGTPTRSAAEIAYVSPTPGTPLPPVVGQIQFNADEYALSSGECTYLRWATVYVDQAYLNGESVALMSSRQVCPTMTTTYTLQGDYSGGSTQKSVTLTVSSAVVPTTPVPVADSQGPAITDISKTQNNIFDGTACGVTSNTIIVKATDASSVNHVVLWYRAKKISPAQTGEWRSLIMISIGGNKYQGIIGITELSSSLGLYADGTVDFYIEATDGLGNKSQSSSQTFSTTMCFG